MVSKKKNYPSVELDKDKLEKELDNTIDIGIQALGVQLAKGLMELEKASGRTLGYTEFTGNMPNGNKLVIKYGEQE